MKRVMKRIMFIMLMILSSFLAFSQSETITATAQSDELANDLDLKAIATAFGDAATVEAFEAKLNDESLALSNLDLNGDGEVDYLRCVESGEGNTRYVIIQAVLAKDVYQDVATIIIIKDQTTGTVTTQVVGDEYIYGANYVVQPVYIYRPVIYDWFWSPSYVYWHSPYYWGYWPYYYHHHHHCYYHSYWDRIHRYHHDHPMGFNHPTHHGGDIHQGDHRHDYASQHGDRGYNTRHPEGGNVRTTGRGDLRTQTFDGHSQRSVQPSGASRTSIYAQPNRTVTVQRGSQPQRSASSIMRTQPTPSRSSTSVSSQRSSSSQPTRTFNGGSSTSRSAFSGPTRSSGSSHSSSPSRGSFSGSSHSSSSRGSFSSGSHSSGPSRSSGGSHSSGSHSSGGSRSGGSHSSGGGRR